MSPDEIAGTLMFVFSHQLSWYHQESHVNHMFFFDLLLYLKGKLQ